MDQEIKNQQEAINFQKRIYDEAIKNKSHAAFGEGILQEIYYEKRVKLALEHSDDRSEVLDLGCGDGTIAKAIAKRACHIDAIDVSEEAIRLAQKNNCAHNIRYICEAMEHFSGKTNYDLVLMYEALEHVFDPSYILSKINKLLPIGGKLIISTPNRERFDTFLFGLLGFLKRRDYNYEICEDHVKEYSYKELKQIMQKNGFRLIKTEALFLSLKISCRLTKNDNILRLLAKSGNLAPRIAHHLYFVLEKTKETDQS